SSSTIERHNEILSRRRNTVLIGPLAEKGNDGRLPIDEGSVHIKGYGIEIGKFQHHGLLQAHPRSFGATIQPLLKVDPLYFFYSPELLRATSARPLIRPVLPYIRAVKSSILERNF